MIVFNLAMSVLFMCPAFLFTRFFPRSHPALLFFPCWGILLAPTRRVYHSPQDIKNRRTNSSFFYVSKKINHTLRDNPLTLPCREGSCFSAGVTSAWVRLLTPRGRPVRKRRCCVHWQNSNYEFKTSNETPPPQKISSFQWHAYIRPI